MIIALKLVRAKIKIRAKITILAPEKCQELKFRGHGHVNSSTIKPEVIGIYFRVFYVFLLEIPVNRLKSEVIDNLFLKKIDC